VIHQHYSFKIKKKNCMLKTSSLSITIMIYASYTYSLFILGRPWYNIIYIYLFNTDLSNDNIEKIEFRVYE